jgi:DNA-binding transcriptional regulator YiaG
MVMTKARTRRKNSRDANSLAKLQELIEAARLKLRSLAKLGTVLGIPLRTLEDWKAGRRKPNIYTEKLVIEQLEKVVG